MMAKPQGLSTQAILRVKVEFLLHGKVCLSSMRLRSSDKLISLEEMKNQTVLKTRIDIFAMSW